MRRFSFEEKHLGTPVRLLIVGAEENFEAEKAAHEAYAECARIEQLYSRFIQDNALAALNAHVGEWAAVDEEFYALIAFSEEVKQKTEGAFDLSVKSILEGWGYDDRYSFVQKAAGVVGRIQLDGARVKLSAPIELGGIGKGYAIDRVGNVLRRYCDDFLVDAGGDLLLSGHDEGGALWRVAFEHPTDTAQAIGVFEGSDLALACSSPSRRQWKNAGEVRHHLVDPRTGKPANKMLAVYTQARDAQTADVYSTALFVLGFERARELLPDLPLEALLVGPRGEIFRSSGFVGELFLT